MSLHKNSEITEFVQLCRKLSSYQRKAVRMMLIYELYQRRVAPIVRKQSKAIRFAVTASLVSFVLLSIMPTHPMAIPAAFGGGLSIALIFV